MEYKGCTVLGRTHTQSLHTCIASQTECILRVNGVYLSTIHPNRVSFILRNIKTCLRSIPLIDTKMAHVVELFLVEKNDPLVMTKLPMDGPTHVVLRVLAGYSVEGVRSPLNVASLHAAR